MPSYFTLQKQITDFLSDVNRLGRISAKSWRFCRESCNRDRFVLGPGGFGPGLFGLGGRIKIGFFSLFSVGNSIFSTLFSRYRAGGKSLLSLFFIVVSCFLLHYLDVRVKIHFTSHKKRSTFFCSTLGLHYLCTMKRRNDKTWQSTIKKN